MNVNLTEDRELLLYILGERFSYNVSPSDPKRTMLENWVARLSDHAVKQAFNVIPRKYDHAEMQKAAVSIINTGNSDKIAFFGVKTWTHHALTACLRKLGNGRYDYEDYLEAPTNILREVRTLAAITNICLSGDLSNGSSYTDEVNGGWAIADHELVSLVARHPDRGEDILAAILERGSCDPQLIEDILTTAPALLDGVL